MRLIFLGTKEERGLTEWNKQLQTPTDPDPASHQDNKQSTYDLPFIMPCLRRMSLFRHLPISPTFTGFFSNKDKQDVELTDVTHREDELTDMNNAAVRKRHNDHNDISHKTQL